ncbi:MAG: GntR family transcriptional regulator [Chloroflexi bacterium]|nr:GntR family transcriptional regulator [Chloroflexota bacterium]
MNPTARPKTQMDSRPLYLRAEEALGQWIDSLSPGERLPTEPELAKRLSISRATLREAMRLFEERGRIARKPGVGTFVLAPHPIIESGLEVLESIDTLARRLNLETYVTDLVVNECPADDKHAASLGLAAGASVVEIARTIYAGAVPVAYLTDVLPTGVVTQEEMENFSGSVLDLLLKRGNPALGQSRTAITAESADGSLARHLSLQRGTPLLHFEAVLYTQDGRAIDHSHSHFTPGYFKFHVVRKVGR